MNALQNMLKWDFILQARYKLIHIAMLSIIIYFIATEAIPEINTPTMHVTMLFFDPALIGIMFVGALILFEKSENTISSLIVTPLNISTYLQSKIITLTTLAVLSATLLTVLNAVFHEITFNLVYLYLGIVLTALMLILLGLIIVARIDSINEYLLSFMLAFLVLIVPPMLHLSGLYQNDIFYLWPTQAAFILLRGTVETLEQWQILYAIGYLLITIVLFYLLALRAFKKHVLKEGG